MIREVCEFQRKILGINKSKISELTASEAMFIGLALQEETAEWSDAIKSGNIVDQVDALLDLAYFAIGGIYKLGLSPEQVQSCFDHIHATNMTKVIGTKVGREGFSTTKDAVLSSSTHKELSSILKSIIEEQNGKST